VSTEPAVRGAIVLAAFRPDPELFRIQLESIRDQTLRDWECLIGADGGPAEVRRLVQTIVGDDRRFQVLGWEDNVGFYLNFERLLAAVPEGVAWVALSDQDDRWYPDKLERLVPLLDHCTLATGQARVITWPEGRVLARTDRRVVPLRALVVQNQVTGGLSVLRRDLLDVALPFPRFRTVTQLHDHWLGVCASAVDAYTVTDVVVQDYIQHGQNVVGEGPGPMAAARAAWAGLVADAEGAEGRHGPLTLARRSHRLSFGWRQVMVETIRQRMRADRASALDRTIPDLRTRRESLRLGAMAILARGFSTHTRLTFLAGLPVALVAPPVEQRILPRMPPNAERQQDGRPPQSRRVAVAVVLYGTAPGSSVAVQTLLASIQAHRDRFSVHVFDNSPIPASEVPVRQPGVDDYISDPSNPGLAAHYQAALDQAQLSGIGWLLLLDQDTEVTGSFVDSLLEAIDTVAMCREDIDIIAPRLVSAGRQLSPHRRVRLRTRPAASAGIHSAEEACHTWNSGTALRVQAVAAVGGFPPEFPLDYLDHAITARLRATGSATLLLDTPLQHAFSMLDRASMSRERLESIVRAEERFYRGYGSRADRAWLAVRRSLLVALVLTRRLGTPSVRVDAGALARALGLVVWPATSLRARSRT